VPRSKSNITRFKKPKNAAKPPVSYSLADPVERIANKIIGYVHGKSSDLPGMQKTPTDGVWLDGMSRLRQAKILFLYTSAATVGRDKLATASKFAKKHLPLADSEYAFEVVVSKPAFEALNEGQRFALVYHELLHCGVNEKEAWVIVPHDLEEFAAVVKYFGIWNERTKVFAEQIRLFDRVAGVRVAAHRK
jgi:hypothetical protein